MPIPPEPAFGISLVSQAPAAALQSLEDGPISWSRSLQGVACRFCRQVFGLGMWERSEGRLVGHPGFQERLDAILLTQICSTALRPICSQQFLQKSGTDSGTVVMIIVMTDYKLQILVSLLLL